MGMDINKLIFAKDIYPRGRHLGSDQEIKWEVENIEKLKDVLEAKKKIDHKITYNKRTMHIIDGTHYWKAMLELGWKDVPKEYLNEIDLPEDAEMIYAVHYNASHGKTLTREEMKACLAEYIDLKTGRMTYGKLKEVAELWNVPYQKLSQWVDDIVHGTRKISCTALNSSGNEGSEAALAKIEASLREKIEMLEDEKDNITQKLVDITMKWDNRPKKCPKCGTMLI